MSRANDGRVRRRTIALALVAVLATGGVVLTAAVATDTFGAGRLFQRAVARVDRFIAGPVPTRSVPPIVRVTPAPATPTPSPTASPTPTPIPDGSSTPGPTAAPTPTPQPTPARKPVDVDITVDHAAIFAHQADVDWCASAGVQMVLAYHGLGDTTNRFQAELQGRVREWESYADSHNGKWGPHAMALALEAYGAPGYEVRAYESRLDALRDAARAIQATGSPVILLAWKGAHTWVMTGFRADADPSVFANAKVSGAYILDPWYPDHSSIWGQSDPPGTFQDTDEMIRNYLRWKRPEGRYADRDGLFISVVPTMVRPAD